MLLRTIVTFCLTITLTPYATAQSTTDSDNWRAPGARSSTSPSDDPLEPRTARNPVKAASSILKAADSPRRSIARVTKGSGTLPNDQGQVWREYDISPYTLRVSSTNQPEQAVVDWILRETGYEAWHGDTVAMLSATDRTLRVYHTQEMQNVVSEIVDRFVNSEAETHGFSLQVATVGHPNWRSRADRLMRNVPTQTQGVQAWLMAKEDAARLMSELSKRSDFQPQTSRHLMVNNGQTTIVPGTQPRTYVRGLLPFSDGRPGLEPDIAQIDEGFSLELNPLLSLDSKSVDAILKFHIDQVEKMIPVRMEATGAASQLVKTEVPQTSSVRLHERFRWPTDKVLLISVGMAASPSPKAKSQLALPLQSGAPRSDTLIFIESKGKVLKSKTAAGASTAAGKRFQRY